MKGAKKVRNRNPIILVEKESESGFTSKCRELRGAINNYGKTMKELKDNRKDAIT
jgi:hypothetical protein